MQDKIYLKYNEKINIHSFIVNCSFNNSFVNYSDVMKDRVYTLLGSDHHMMKQMIDYMDTWDLLEEVSKNITYIRIK